MIKVGDLVIRNTGGNKMRVLSIHESKAECVWITERFNQDYFDVDELLPISDYKTLFKNEKRADKLNVLLGITS